MALFRKTRNESAPDGCCAECTPACQARARRAAAKTAALALRAGSA